MSKKYPNMTTKERSRITAIIQGIFSSQTSNRPQKISYVMVQVEMAYRKGQQSVDSDLPENQRRGR